MEENFQELMTKMKALNEDFQKLRKSAHCEVQLIRASLESKQGKKEEEISRALLSRIEKEFRQLLETNKTLEKDLWKLPESTKHELQLLRIDLEKNQGGAVSILGDIQSLLYEVLANQLQVSLLEQSSWIR